MTTHLSHSETIDERELALTDAERAKMRALLFDYLQQTPFTAQPIRSPFSFLYWCRPLGVLAALILVVLAGSGTIAYAAEGSLPGDALYPVKVAVTEPVETALIASPDAQAAWQMTLAERRVSEAVALANAGKLSAPTETELAMRFTQSATAATRAAASVSSANSVGASVATARFAAQLAGYENVLAAIDTERHSDTSIALRATVHTEVALLTRADASGATDASPAEVAREGEAAESAVASTAALVHSTSLDASTSAQVELGLEAASTSAARGKILLNERDTQGAANAFQNSLSASSQLQVVTHAAATLKIPVSTSPNQ